MKPYLLPLFVFLFLGSGTAGELPEKVQKLREQRSEKISEINKVFLRELRILLVEFTKAGDLESANAISELIAKTAVDSEDEEITLAQDLPKNDNDLRIFLRDTQWAFEGGRKITFQRNGKVKKSWGVLEPKWSVKDLKVVYEEKAFVFNETFTTIEETTKKEFPGIGRRVGE